MTTKDDNKRWQQKMTSKSTRTQQRMTRPHIPYSQWQNNTHQRRRIYTKQDNAHKHAHKNQNFKQETKNKNVKNKQKCDNKNKPQILKYKYWPINDYYISIRYRLSIITRYLRWYLSMQALEKPKCKMQRISKTANYNMQHAPQHHD